MRVLLNSTNCMAYYAHDHGFDGTHVTIDGDSSTLTGGSHLG